MVRPRVYSRHIRCHRSSEIRAVPTGCPTAPPKAATLIENQELRRLRTLPHFRCRRHPADQERGVAWYGDGVALSALAHTFGVTPPAVRR